MMNEQHAIAVLSDQSHLEKTKQVIYSSYKYGNWKGSYILLAHEISDKEQLEWFTCRGIQVVHTQHMREHGKSREKPVSIYYAKLQLFHPSFQKYKSIIYLDTDMIVRKDLTGLLRFNTFAAADDCFRNLFRHQFGLPPKREIKRNNWDFDELTGLLKPYNLDQPAFNAGMMVIDSHRNTPKRYEEIMELVQKLGSYSVFGDQGVLNAYFQGTRKRIPYVYNDFYQSDDFNRLGLIGRRDDSAAVILHLTYPVKPWDPKSSYYREWIDNTRAAEGLFDKVEQVGQKPRDSMIMVTEFINHYNIAKINAKFMIARMRGF